MKTCRICNNELPLDNFNKYKRSADGLDTMCKSCSKAYYFKNKEGISASHKKYRTENKDKIKEINRVWHETNKKECYETALIWRADNVDRVNEINKKSNKVHYNKNREECIQISKDYYKANKDTIRERKRKYEKEKKANDPLYKLKCRVKCLIAKSFLNNGYSKESRTLTILGCTYEEFKVHLETKFQPWMSWENRGKYNGKLNFGWDIDHIIPLDTATSEEDILKLNHYTNLQALCSKVNREVKRNKIGSY